MKRSLLFSILVTASLIVAVGSFSYGATIDHKTEQSAFVADLGDSLDASASIVFGMATLEVYPDITPVYLYSGEVKRYTFSSSFRRINLSRMARDGLS